MVEAKPPASGRQRSWGMAKYMLCEQEAADGADRCVRHDRIYRRSLRKQEDDNTKGLFQKGFEIGSGFSLGFTLMSIPIAIIVVVIVAVCQV